MKHINSNPRKRVLHLYNREKEGLGSYDVHYINAYKNHKRPKNISNHKANGRFAA